MAPLCPIPPTTSIFAFRHGQSEANVQGLIVSSPSVGPNSYDLSDLGRSQAQESALAFAEFLRARFPQAQHSSHQSVHIYVHSSPFLRARTTARIVVDALSEEFKSNSVFSVCNNLIVHPDLRERFFGDWDLGPDVHYKDVWREDEMLPAPSQLSRWWNSNYIAGPDRPHELSTLGVGFKADKNGSTISDADTDQEPGETSTVLPSRNSRNVEDVLAVLCRSSRVVETIVATKIAPPSSPTPTYTVHILAAHGDVLQILLAAYAGVDPSRHRSLPHLETAGWRELGTSTSSLRS
ncbi:hypothetical protein HDU93_005158 [Gonapodya sp. JEL0774]|nr:hypothetical protein HDU93_005158 [Gonapodya sp. JEL0774]